MRRLSVPLALALLFGMASTGGAVDLAGKCLVAKRKALAKRVDAELRCVAKATASGLPVMPECFTKAGDKMAVAWAKAEAKGGCASTSDLPSATTVAAGCVRDLRAVLQVGASLPGRSACSTSKLRASGKRLTGVGSCHNRAALRQLPVDPLCLAKADTKYGTAFGAAELRGDCLTLGDLVAVQAEIDACVGEVLGAFPTPTTTTTTTTSTTTTTLGNCSESEPASASGATAAHNAVRAGASPTPNPALDPLCWKSAAAATAQAWANGCQWAHNPAAWALGYGENLYARTGSSTTPAVFEEAIASWADEASSYNYANNTCSGVCGHYTQIVWRTTDFVGCAKANCTTGSPFGSRYPNWVLVVCNYNPPGNTGARPY